MLTFKTSSVLVLIALLVVWFFQFPWWIGIAVLLVYTGLLVWGSIRVDSQFYMKAVVKGAGGERRIVISFDDGPLPEGHSMRCPGPRKAGILVCCGLVFLLFSQGLARLFLVEVLVAVARAIPEFPVYQSARPDAVEHDGYIVQYPDSGGMVE